ncbi:unnamed protein product [Prunus armeniaca]
MRCGCARACQHGLRRTAERRRPSKTRAGWLTTGEAVPSGSSQTAAPQSSAYKPRPQPWTGRNQEGAPDFLQIVLRFTIRDHGEVVRQKQRVRPSEAHPELGPSPLGQAIEKFITGSRGIMLPWGPGKRICQRLAVGNVGRSPQLWEVSLQPELEGP